MRKLLIIFLFGWSVAFGQTTVPNTATFTLGQVTKVIYGDSAVGRNTATIFADSNAAYFDATYGSKTMNPQTINGFRNYKASDVAVTSQTATATGSTTATISYSISSTNYALTDWVIMCYTPNYTYVGQTTGSTSGYSASISQSYTGLSTSTSYLFYCYGVDASGNAAAEWTNQITTSGCTRPGGLYTATFYTVVNGVTVTSGNYCTMGSTACGTCTGSTGQTTFTDGDDVYAGTGTDCTKLADGYYAVWDICGNECWRWYGYQVSGGKIYFCYM